MKRTLSLTILGLSLLVPAAGYGNPQEKLTLLMLGDSITQSGSVPAGQKMSAFTRLELDRLSRGRAEWLVVNEGVGRETARGARRRIRRVLAAVNPDFLTIAYGLVDGRKQDPAWFEENVVQLIRTISECRPTTRIVLISTVPIDESIHAYGKERSFKKLGGANRYINSEINGLLRKIAGRESLPFIDLFRYLTPRPEWWSAIREDGVHPDAAGNRLIGEYIGRALSAYYEARVLNIRPAGEKESEARRLMREAAGLFFAQGFKAVERCAELEDRAWKICPYLPETTAVFAAASRSPQALRRGGR